MDLPKKKVLSNPRVIIYPKRLGDFGSVSVSDAWVSRDRDTRVDMYLRRCNEIVDDVKRHVDHVDDIEIVWDEAITCAHCGSDWKPDASGCNWCCTQHVHEFEEALRAESPAKYKQWLADNLLDK